MKYKIVSAKNVVCTYFRETTVHGFRYVVDGANVFERGFWMIVIIASFFVSAQVILSSYRNWANVPLQTTISTASFPIENLSFPATTVCNRESLQMPRRNRRLFIEQLLNSMEADNSEEKGNTLKATFYN